MSNNNTKQYLSEQLQNCINILLRFERREGKHRVDNREPLNFYLGYSGVLASLLIAVKGLSVVSSSSSSLSHYLQQSSPNLSNFINHIVTLMLNHCETTLKLIKTSDGSSFYQKDDAHTLMFSQFGSSLSVLHQLRFHFKERDQEASPFETYCLAPENKTRLQSLLPSEISFAKILISIYSPLNKKVDEFRIFINRKNGTSLECEPFYGKVGLVALFLSSISSLSSSSSSSAETTQIRNTILQHFCLPMMNSILQSGYTQSQSYQEFVKSKLGSSSSSSNNVPPLLFFWHGQAYLGAAHGTAGIIFYCIQTLLLLQQQNAEDGSAVVNSDFILSSFKETLQLAKCKASNNYLPTFDYFARHDDDKLVQFCHGAPGFVFGLSQVCRLLLLGEKSSSTSLNQFWLPKLLEAGEETWKRGCLKDSVGLCHSVSGNGYALMSVLRVLKQIEKKATKTDGGENDSNVWFERVLHFAKESVTIAPKIHLEGDHIFSLYEGLAGTLSFVGSVLILVGGDSEGFAVNDEKFLKMPGFEV